MTYHLLDLCPTSANRQTPLKYRKHRQLLAMLAQWTLQSHDSHTQRTPRASIIAARANLGWPTPTQALRTPRSILHEKYTKCLWVAILYYIPVQSNYVCNHDTSPRICSFRGSQIYNHCKGPRNAMPFFFLWISVNADFSTAQKCLASDRKSIEQLLPHCTQ